LARSSSGEWGSPEAARRQLEELVLQRAGGSAKTTCARVGSRCVRRGARRNTMTSRTHKAGSSLRRQLWRTAELGRWCACARNEQGLVYIIVGGRLRVDDVTPVPGARAVWAAFLGDVRFARRPMACGRRCTDECGLATWHPPAVVNVTHRRTPVQRSDR
jgi:hypothetical protein